MAAMAIQSDLKAPALGWTSGIPLSLLLILIAFLMEFRLLDK
jgi:hypothetical protein